MTPTTTAAQLSARRLRRPAQVHKEPGYEMFGEKWIRTAIYEKRIRYYKIGAGRMCPVLVDLDDLDALIEAGRHEPAEAFR